MPTIKLQFWFKGVETNGKRIAPGVYAIDDPQLMGLGEYFVRVGHAVVVSHDETVTVESTPDLDAMTKAELISFADERGIDVNARDTKADIRSAIDAALL